MRKLIIYLSLCATIMAACDDKDKNDGPEPANEYRVAQIKGRDSHWGEYTMTMQYHLQALDSIIVKNDKGERVAFMVSSQSSDGALIFSMQDIVPNIDADSIAKLVEQYGEQGAKEHIPTVERELSRVRSEFSKGVLNAQTFTYFRPKDDNGTGTNFNSEYLNDKRMRYVYEYDNAGGLYICRIFEDVYDNERNTQYVRTLYKTVANLSGRQISEVSLYRSDDHYQSEESYELEDTFRFTYSGDQLSAVNGASQQLGYTWSGGNLTAIQHGTDQYRYQYNSDGTVRRVDMPDGNYMEMTYEKGEGDYGLYTPLIERTFGVPYIQ